jgi:serine/threonine-protein kinase
MAWGALDERADVYSLGVTLYRAICGIHPFPILTNDLVSSSSEFLTLLARGRKNISPPSRMLLETSPLLDAVLLKALAYDPFSRYRNANEFEMALQTLATEYPDE